jgi:NADH-quinone oxidoreductase subunit G
VRSAEGRLEAASWEEAFKAIAGRLGGMAGEKIAAVAGDLCDAESMLALKDLMGTLGSPNLECRQDGAKLDPGTRAGYLFNTGIAGIEQADAVLLVGTNPRWEAPMINARLRKRFLAGGLAVGAIGPAVDLTYPVESLGAGPETLKQLASGKGAFAKTLKSAERPMIVLGSGALARPDGAAVLALGRKLAEACDLVRDDWNGFNVLHRAASRVGALDLGFVPGEGGRDLAGILEGAASGEVEAVYLLGADELDLAALDKAFVIYQGHHGDAAAHLADVILPGAAYTEKNGTYVNAEGRVQLGRLASFPPGEAREDWTILRALSEVVGERLPYDNLGALRQRLIGLNPVFAAIDQVERAPWEPFGRKGPVDSAPFELPIDDYYRTDPISRASETMARCSEELLSGNRQEATGTHG